ncbi:hypothetical protein BGX23_001184 [Mortierella sp. AD031]|nr:hypothetical protein BGX23_001184 [Mortierella sp. AD031]
MDGDPRQYELRYVRKIKAIEVRAGPGGVGRTDIDSYSTAAAEGYNATIASVASVPGAVGANAGADADPSATETTKIQSPQQPQTTLQEQQQQQCPGPQSILHLVADTNRTGEAQPLEAQQDFADIQLTLQHQKQSHSQSDDESEEDDDNKNEGINTNGIPGYLHLDIPLVMNMDPVYGSGIVYNFKRQSHIPSDVGLENLALWSEHDPTDSYGEEDEHHGWFAVMIDHCENCWVADIRARNIVSGIKASPGSKHVTVQDCEVTDPVSLRSEGGRRYMFMLQGQMGLVKRCLASDGRHDFITGSKTAGPNVFVDSEGVRASNDAGPHDRWTTGTLHDNIHSYDLNVRNRGWMGSGQGWSGAFHVVYHSSAEAPSHFQSPLGATNWIIEYQDTLGEKTIEFDGDDATFLDPEPSDIGWTPRSLYWSRLVARMGNDSRAAEWVGQMVGYSQALPRRFLTLDEIVIAEGALELSGPPRRRKKWDMDEDEAEASIAQLQRDIQRREHEIREYRGYDHEDEEGGEDEEDSW